MALTLRHVYSALLFTQMIMPDDSPYNPKMKFRNFEETVINQETSLPEWVDPSDLCEILNTYREEAANSASKLLVQT